ncbi:CCAAT/enhancer-binding protein zeta [Echinococcus granulosus]|uniref:CCAAT/enhancer-binding protein zeta n=2 Tax=Echinococcus granulosus TaxID=6210 RepID=W6UQX1_ECHGR|nr:CCAAT/enhancer-binding protein zeta [Echinococcus granulosus]EUB63086.1 CCAAT/enhancer-binding protein zeta [Echinococcus granulosus]
MVAASASVTAMAKAWFSNSYTQLESESPEVVNVNYQETRARNIFDKYFIISKSGALLNDFLYDGKDRVIQEWLSTVLRRGTSVDRVLALAFMVRKNPLSSLQHIESLLASISPVKNQLCMKATEVLSNLFENFLLPSMRALIAFENRPFKVLAKYPAALTDELTLKNARNGLKLPHNCRENILALWYFEHRIKQFYFLFLTSLELAISIVVNKLGDRSRGFASSVIHKLRIMCQSHPYLKAMLVEQIRIFLFRPNLLDRAKYYAIVLLSCIPLSKRNSQLVTVMEDAATSDTTVAAILFRIYLSFFRASVSSKELPERLTAVLLAGISRVAPYLSPKIMSENVTDVNAIFRLVHVTTNFTISLQALNFLFHFTSHQQQLRNRYYQALYRKLTDSAIRWTARGPFILNLLYQSLLADTDAGRRAALIHRLLSICLNHPNSGFAAGSLILLEKLYSVGKANPIGSAPGQSVKPQKDSKSVLPTSVGIVKHSHYPNAAASDSDEEHFSDVLASGEEEKGEDAVGTKEKETSIKFSEGIWDHRRLFKKTKKWSIGDAVGYDSSARDPRFAHALNQPCWQLSLLVNHVHPTVAYFARSLTEGRIFKYTGDPFEDLSVAHFMERFVYKKPKPSSVAKPGKMVVDTDVSKRVHAKTLAPNSLAYKNLNAELVPSDERFIHSYFNFINAKPSKSEGGRSSDGSDLDEDFDEYLRNHEKGLIPNDADEDGLLNNSDFNYSTDEEEEELGKVKKRRSDGVTGSEEKESFEEEEGGEGIGGLGCEEEDNDSDTDDEDDFVSSRSRKCGRIDLNKLFVSAEEIGNLYDNQEAPEGSSSNRPKWQDRKRSQPTSRKTKRGQASFALKRQKFQRKRGVIPSATKKPRRR